MNFEKEMKATLNEAIEKVKQTEFCRSLMSGENAKEIYKSYLYHAYHYVVNTAGFTPLAARRMSREYVRVRKWVLEHSGEEMGHELMALRDLQILGVDSNDVVQGDIPIGVTAWMSFFHFKVAQANPWSMFGVLYFLEGMAQSLAPALLTPIAQSLNEDEKKAISFFREHGELDHDHMQEQEALLFSTKISEDDQQAILSTIKEAAEIKVFMLNTLMRDLK